MGGASKVLMLVSCPPPPPVVLLRRPALRLLVRHSPPCCVSKQQDSNSRRLLLLFSTTSSCSAATGRFYSFNSYSSQQQKRSYYSSRDNSSNSVDTSIHYRVSSPQQQHPWPEWIDLIHNLPPQSQSQLDAEDDLIEDVNQHFIQSAIASLSFARQANHLLRSLPRTDIEVVVQNGSPFLFKSALNSAARMKSFLNNDSASEDRAQLVDLMRFILSYVYTASDQPNLTILHSSVRNLLRELAATVVPDSMPKHFSTATPLKHNIEMKRGDWICTKCSFMNFARNRNCLECDETRPMRQLTGGEWHCPQCDFFNYGKNVVCLRCDCKAPGEATGTAGSRFGLEYNNENKANVYNTSTIPLEQRLTNAGMRGGNTFQSSDGVGLDISSRASGGRNLGRILGGSSEGNKSDYVPFNPLPSDMFNKPQKPMAEDKQVISNNYSAVTTPNELTSPGKSSDILPLSRKPVNQTVSKEDEEQAEKSERWFNKVAELHDVTDLASAISDEDFPEIMPMRKGENRFVVSKKKDRSLTSPLHKRRMALEQTNNSTSYVPFVPFPPDYFAKKDKVPEAEASTGKDISRTSASAGPERHSVVDTSMGQKPTGLDYAASENSVQSSQIQHGGKESRGTSFSKNSDNRVGYLSGRQDGNSREAPIDVQAGSRERWNSASWEDSRSSPTRSTGNASEQSGSVHNTKETWNGGFSGKSLEGSLVKEPDPLDMSEEAKAERWFRRAAQIKDISELSQIPDEDFPTIMPMRKGVNRFVVSKRKTPLERRLTSPQYRRNLPIVSSEPVKKENTES